MEPDGPCATDKGHFASSATGWESAIVCYIGARSNFISRNGGRGALFPGDTCYIREGSMLSY
jgi:hypothetical protein